MNNSRPVVVVVAEATPMRGGIATFAETISADPLLAQNFDVELLNTGRVATREGGKFNLQNVKFAVADVWHVYRASQRSDIVHLQLVANSGWSSLRAAALNIAASLGRAKLIAHVHSGVGNAGLPWYASYGPLDRLALRTLRLANMVCTVSNTGTLTMREFAGRTPVETVDNAVDVDAFPVTRADGEPPTVLFIGLICHRKGLVELARASRVLHERGVVDWNLILVGGQGPTPESEYNEIIAEFESAGLSESLVGPEYGEQIKTRLNQADIFVMPGYLEGQPMAIIEAMASGLPVVAYAAGGVPDMIRDGIEGRLVAPGDSDALADALGDVIVDRTARLRMAEASRRRAEDQHDLKRLSARLTEIYRTVLDVKDPLASDQRAEEIR
ncbi:glycosyltransferase family 4 protein [Kocuria rosea]|uniref:glycosyltransferase family 4 protein n=1 Tax=Kocuria rosea TaxID=1275 RepID=UPI0010A37A78|nr:glycosyltransferase family 4 protein [Kocuria rosea]MEB2528885.1 glycosyltransferase family 4 protein [Kocuria rosea]MEB2618790.1 glycosyltransferase family 4 protein [Kocuria rosea]THE19445.1 glycosyltransferase family 1 protein [Kocuria rosea]